MFCSSNKNRKKRFFCSLDESSAIYKLFFTDYVKVFQRDEEDPDAFALITYKVSCSTDSN